jgi:hypothetical protein
MDSAPIMLLAIDCIDLSDGLCRTLDQARRMDMTLLALFASSAEGGGMAKLMIQAPSQNLFAILADRVRQMSSVRSVLLNA